MKGRPSDKTLKNTIQNSQKYNSNNMHVYRTGKKNVMLLSLVKSPKRNYADFLNFQEYLVSLSDSLHILTAPKDSLEA